MPGNKMPKSTPGLTTVAAGSAIYFLSSLFSAAIPFALLPVFTRYLTPSEYGEVAIFQTLVAGLPAVIGLSVDGVANRKYYDGRGAQLRQFIGNCVYLVVITTTLALLLLLALRRPASDFLQLGGNALFLGLLASVSTVLIQLRLGQWQVRNQASRYGLFQIAAAAAGAVVSLLLVVVAQQGAQGRIEAQAFTTAAFAILAVWLLWRDKLLGLTEWHGEHVREALGYGVPLLPHVIGLFLLSSIDRVIIASNLGLAEAGVYAVAMQLAGALGMVFGSINTAFVPWLFERLTKDVPEDKQSIVRMTYAHFAFSLLIAALAFVVGPWAVVKVAGERYAAAGEIIGFLVLGQVFGGMYLMVCNYVFFSKRTGALSTVTITSGVLNVALLAGLAQLFGLRGAAVAYALTMGIRFLATWWVANRRHPMPWMAALRNYSSATPS